MHPCVFQLVTNSISFHIYIKKISIYFSWSLTNDLSFRLPFFSWIFLGVNIIGYACHDIPARVIFPQSNILCINSLSRFLYPFPFPLRSLLFSNFKQFTIINNSLMAILICASRHNFISLTHTHLMWNLNSITLRAWNWT